MAKSFNKTIIVGRLGADPEMKTTNSINLNTGKQIEMARFQIGNTIVSDGKEETKWYDLVAFGKQAILCHDNLHKGDLCCVEGFLDKQTYMSNGEEKTHVSIVAERITFLSQLKRKETNNEVSGNEE